MKQLRRVPMKEISFSGYNIPYDTTVIAPDRVAALKGWLQQRALDLNLITMAATPKQANGFFVNMTYIGSLILIVTFLGGIIGGLYKYTADTNYEKGKSDVRQEIMQKEIDALKAKQAADDERLNKLDPKPEATAPVKKK
jgi:hypothetical protein